MEDFHSQADRLRAAMEEITGSISGISGAVDGAVADVTGVADSTRILVEDLGNLVANEVFSPEGGGERAVRLGLEHLRRQAKHLILVGNEIFSDGEAWQGEMAAYLRLLAQAQAACAAWSGAAGAVICGIPLWQKRPKESWFEELIKEAEPP